MSSLKRIESANVRRCFAIGAIVIDTECPMESSLSREEHREQVNSALAVPTGKKAWIGREHCTQRQARHWARPERRP
jgi:hypothetical protein